MQVLEIMPAVPTAQTKTAETTSLIQTCRLIWRQLAMDANLELTIWPILLLFCACVFPAIIFFMNDLNPLVKNTTLSMWQFHAQQGFLKVTVAATSIRS